jgi:hypothetical protein
MVPGVGKKHALWLGTALVIRATVGCDSSSNEGNDTSPVNPSESDAGSGGRRATGGAPAAGGESSTGGMSADASSADSGGSGSFDAGFGTVDPGEEPPDFCVAPCVWEMIKPCVPELHACVSEPTTPYPGTEICDPSTGWSNVDYYSISTSVFTVLRNGVTCFSQETNVKVRMSVVRSYTGATAITTDNVVYCGASPADVGVLTPVDGGVVTEDGKFFPRYVMRPSDPACAKWSPRGFPVTAECESTDAGTCPVSAP